MIIVWSWWRYPCEGVTDLVKYDVEFQVIMKKPVKSTSFKLRFYEGYKGRETPRSVIIGTKEFLIEEILERKRVRHPETGKTMDVFTCRMDGKKVRIAFYESGEFEMTFL